MENYSKKFKEAIVSEDTVSRKLNSMAYPRNISATELMKKVRSLLLESQYGFGKKMRNMNVELNDVLNKNESLLPILDSMIYDSLYLFTPDALEVIEYFANIVENAFPNMRNHFIHAYSRLRKTEKEFEDIDLDHTNYIIFKSLIQSYADNYGIDMNCIFKYTIDGYDFEKSDSDSSEDIEKEFKLFKVFEKFALANDLSEI